MITTIIKAFFVLASLFLSSCMLSTSKNVSNVPPETGTESAPTIEKVTAITTGSITTDATIDIQIHFSTPVLVTGIPRLKLAAGVFDKYAVYSSGSGSKVLTLKYTVGAGDQTALLDYRDTQSLELNGGQIVSEAGLPSSLSLPTPGAGASLSNSASISLVPSTPVATLYTILPTGSTSNVYGSSVSDSKGVLYASAGSGGLPNKVFRSLDKGATWSSIYEFPSSTTISAIKFDGSSLWLSKIDNVSRKMEIMKSTNGGTTWTSVHEFAKQVNTSAFGLVDVEYTGIAMEIKSAQEIWIYYGYFYFDCCNGGGDDIQYSFTTKQYSTDGGLTWSAEIDTNTVSYSVRDFFSNSIRSFSIADGVLRTLILPGPTGWTSLSHSSLSAPTAGAISGAYVYMGSSQMNSWKVSRGDEQGANWTVVDNFAVHAGNYSINSIKTYKDYIFTCGASPRSDGQSHEWLVRYSRDYGNQWLTLETSSEPGNSNYCSDLIVQEDGTVYAFGVNSASGSNRKVVLRKYKF